METKHNWYSDYSVNCKARIFSRVPLWNWTSIEYPETIWNLNSYSHNAELNNFYIVKIINFLLISFWFSFKIKILFQFLKINKIWKINFLLKVGFEPLDFATSGFRDQRLNHWTTGASWLRTNHTELLCINGIMWYKSLESINSTNNWYSYNTHTTVSTTVLVLCSLCTSTVHTRTLVLHRAYAH